MPQKSSINWSEHEYEYNDKTPDWFWALGIIAVSGSLAAIIFGNLLFALLILIGAFTMALYGAKRPNMVTFSVNERGVTVGKTFFPYTSLDSFWIDHDEGKNDKLLLKSKKFFMPFIVLPVKTTDSQELRDFLLEHLEEEEHEEPFSERILEFFGF